MVDISSAALELIIVKLEICEEFGKSKTAGRTDILEMLRVVDILESLNTLEMLPKAVRKSILATGKQHANSQNDRRTLFMPQIVNNRDLQILILAEMVR